MTNMFTAKNLHLILSSLIILIVAFTYGLLPEKSIRFLLGFNSTDINLKQVFRANMGLYLGNTALWISGILQTKLWFSATLSSMVFFGGLALGRLIGILTDGIPAAHFWIGMLVECILFVWAIVNLRIYHFTSFNKNPPPGAR